jgi:DNA-binding Xre family transcriptional regulator
MKNRSLTYIFVGYSADNENDVYRMMKFNFKRITQKRDIFSKETAKIIGIRKNLQQMIKIKMKTSEIPWKIFDYVVLDQY